MLVQRIVQLPAQLPIRAVLADSRRSGLAGRLRLVGPGLGQGVPFYQMIQTHPIQLAESHQILDVGLGLGRFPFAHRLPGDAQLLGQPLLGIAMAAAQLGQPTVKCIVFHACLLAGQNAPFSFGFFRVGSPRIFMLANKGSKSHQPAFSFLSTAG